MLVVSMLNPAFYKKAVNNSLFTYILVEHPRY